MTKPVLPVRPRAALASSAAALVLAIAAAYWGVWTFDFVGLDDPVYVIENPHVAGLRAENVKWAFTTFHQSTWLPLTYISFMVDHELWGAWAGGYHLDNLLLHTASTLVLLLALTRMTGNVWRSAAVAAVFAVHPLHVESVAWISERKDVLSGLFWHLALLAYASYAAAPKLGRYVLVAAAMAFGSMAKSMVITLPVVLLLLDYWPLGRLDGRALLRPRLLEKMPLFLLSASCALVTYLAHQSKLVSFATLGWGVRISNAVVSYGHYLLDTVWPTGLTVLYPHPGAEGHPAALVAGPLVALIVVTVLAIRRLRDVPYLAVGWFWFLITMMPAAGLVQFSDHARADRFMYLPQTGLAILLVWGAGDALARFDVRPPLRVAAVAAVVATMAAASWIQVRYWRDSEALFTRAVAVTERNARAHHALGVALSRQGRHEAAISHYQTSLEINPGHPNPLVNLAVSSAQLGRPAEALDYSRRALAMQADKVFEHVRLGVFLAREGHSEVAESAFRDALEVDPSRIDARYNLAQLLATSGRRGEATAELEAVLVREPDHGPALRLLEKLRQAGPS